MQLKYLFFAETQRKRNDEKCSSARPSHFFIARTSPPPKSVAMIKTTTRHDFRHVTFSPAISELREAAETIWRRVVMAIVKSSLCFTTILHGSFMFSFKKSPFTLEFQMPRGQKVSRLLATSSKFLVANAQFLVALATSQSQCRT